jgi:hypothetical protein
MDPDLALHPDGYRLVGKIKLPINWRRYDRPAARIEKEHPGVRSFPGGNTTLFAVPVACSLKHDLSSYSPAFQSWR